MSEALECFGGAGYVEDTGLPMLLRDSQVFPIWEGTTNVLALDALRAAAASGAMTALGKCVDELTSGVKDGRLAHAANSAQLSITSARRWLETVSTQGTDALEAGARRFALTIGRTLELALLIRHAQWSLKVENHGRTLAAALRFARQGVDLTTREDGEHSRLLALG